jgi:hypothetical protein
LEKTWRLNSWKAFSVSGARARRFWAKSLEADGGYNGLVIIGLHSGSVLPASRRLKGEARLGKYHMWLAGARIKTRLDQPAFNRDRLKAEKLIDSKVLEQLIRVQMDAGCSSTHVRVLFGQISEVCLAISPFTL